MRTDGIEGDVRGRDPDEREVIKGRDVDVHQGRVGHEEPLQRRRAFAALEIHLHCWHRPYGWLCDLERVRQVDRERRTPGGPVWLGVSLRGEGDGRGSCIEGEGNLKLVHLGQGKAIVWEWRSSRRTPFLRASLAPARGNLRSISVERLCSSILASNRASQISPVVTTTLGAQRSSPVHGMVRMPAGGGVRTSAENIDKMRWAKAINRLA
ncbi:hypothetical protein B0H17DRAFT_1088425 [Mycena rosella]|uniref:Uncharacterized protein n=1 Tax=Mycena rosella TaxID=1033263 RepID=A0AAD7D0Q2_MYCRO|nr:hypothetical protein B0H17DRAFT_1088425 [Mycena rosella]